MTITCAISIKESTEVSWYKDGSKLAIPGVSIPDNTELTNLFTASTNTMTSSFVLGSMSDSDKGIYRCSYTSKLDGNEKLSDNVTLNLFGKHYMKCMNTIFK